jgi:hypothetical protein
MDDRPSEIRDAIYRTSFKARGERIKTYMERAHRAEGVVNDLLSALNHALTTKHDIRTCACAECEKAREIKKQAKMIIEGITEEGIEETRCPASWREAHRGRE